MGTTFGEGARVRVFGGTGFGAESRASLTGCWWLGGVSVSRGGMSLLGTLIASAFTVGVSCVGGEVDC